MHDKLEACLKDWGELAEEYQDLERKHKEYRQILEKSISLQKKCLSGITHQKYRLNVIRKLMKEIEPSSTEEQGELDDLQKDILRRQSQLSQMMECLPQKSGRYLRVIMGNVDVSILDKNMKYQYKEQYESFKLIVNLIGGVITLLNYFLNYRVLDLVIFFLIVWYYCTLTIRESILIVNGSRIKGWWRLHHFISCVAGGVLLVWPDGSAYREFRDQLMLINVYITFLQYLQYVYQKGCLYRLRSLGERQDMDITIDGFHSWMWKGLGFLLPFLYIGYLTQLYNAYTLYRLCDHPNASWQIPVLTAIFFLLGAGNIITTSMTIPMKWVESKSSALKYKFIRLDKYFWNHRRRRISASQANPALMDHVDRILRRSGSDFRSNTKCPELKEVINEVEENEDSGSQTSDEPQETLRTLEVPEARKESAEAVQGAQDSDVDDDMSNTEQTETEVFSEADKAQDLKKTD